MNKKKPESYEEAQENLRLAFKEVGKSLDESFKITPLVLGINKRANWLERKIAEFKFRRWAKSLYNHTKNK